MNRYTNTKKFYSHLNKHQINTSKYTYNLIKKYLENSKKKISSVLDVGCGCGFGIYLLALRFKNINFMGVDDGNYNNKTFFSFKNIILPNNLQFINKNILELQDGNFDLVYSIDVIEHNHNYEDFLNKLILLKIIMELC